MRRDPLFKLLGVSLLFAAELAILAVGGLYLLDIGGLRHLIEADQAPLVALSLLLFGFALSFAGGVLGTAMVQLGAEETSACRNGHSPLDLG